MSDGGQPVAKITQQIETVGRDPSGAIVQGVTVHFQTAKGVNGSVFIPKDTFSAANVMAAVRQAAMQLDELQGMEVS
jgi:hypothetical protein